jgi:hypothetical protein
MSAESADIEIVVVAVRHDGRIRWFRSDRDLWVLDVNKWRNEFISHGYDVPEFTQSYRFGIHVIDQQTAARFLEHMSKFEVPRDELSIELAKRFTSARSWWDVKDLFPIMFVDFDARKVAAFYSEGTPMERYVPEGWSGEFIDFATEYPEQVFPAKEKFWIKGDADLLKLLNERGARN